MSVPTAYILLSAKQTRAIEQTLFARGTESYALMRRAGEAVARMAARRYPSRNFLVLAGPGNNGGDGFVAAQALLQAGYKVELASLAGTHSLTGDASRAAQGYKGRVVPLAQTNLDINPVVIDALFGIGLTRAIEGEAADIIHAIAARKMDVMSVDMPSGVNSDSGEIKGCAMNAAVTVTFISKKCGHLLMPGRMYCGEVVVEALGAEDEVLAQSNINTVENTPLLWRHLIPWPKPEHNKYHRGHTLVIGGEALRAGAAKLAAMAALRSGSGLVSIVCASKDVPVYAGNALSLMTEERRHWKKLLADKRKSTVLIGPGAGVGKATREAVLLALHTQKRAVLDADALTSFSSTPQGLFAKIHSPCILTPHGGEFAKLFPNMKGSKLEKVRAAAKASHAVVVLKGYDTVIASPDGRAAINSNAPANLATAGAGDVLSGICAGLLAQGMEPFEAACGAVWIHGEAARQQEAGLIAEDVLRHLPFVLSGLKTAA